MLPLVHRCGVYVFDTLQGMDVRLTGKHCDVNL